MMVREVSQYVPESEPCGVFRIWHGGVKSESQVFGKTSRCQEILAHTHVVWLVLGSTYIPHMGRKYIAVLLQNGHRGYCHDHVYNMLQEWIADGEFDYIF